MELHELTLGLMTGDLQRATVRKKHDFRLSNGRKKRQEPQNSESAKAADGLELPGIIGLRSHRLPLERFAEEVYSFAGTIRTARL